MARTHHRSPIIADVLQLEIFPKFVKSRPCSRASRLLCITCGSGRITQTMARIAKTPVRLTSCDVLRHPSSRPPRLSRGEPVVLSATARQPKELAPLVPVLRAGHHAAMLALSFVPRGGHVSAAPVGACSDSHRHGCTARRLALRTVGTVSPDPL